nr:hypothetical protein CKG001_09790 [Bdellovibrio sp. CKG001]BFD62297.1 hypothetical protein BdHM001_09780 [Bdellovibrio sp. HM001]
MKLLKRFGTFAVYASVLLGASWVQAQSLGSLTVNGQAAPSQVFKKVKVAQCVQGQSGSCGKPVFFDLNVRQELPAGTYLVGFENTLYPGLVSVQAGQNTVLNLERLDIPAIKGERVVVYRNLYSKAEQDKFLSSFFYNKKSFFRLEKGNFGDLYLTGAWEKDSIQRLSYEGCPGRLSERAKNELPEADRKRILEVDQLCNLVRDASSPSDLAGLFDFSSDKNGRIVQNWVSAPGIKMTITHDRYLVATPTRPGSYVMVFPGSYTVQALGKDAKAGVSVQVGM